MGFSTSGAVAILFVGMLIAVGIAYPAVQTAHDQRSAAIDDRDDRALDVRNTAIDDIEASYEPIEDDPGTLTVNATNAGSTTLSIPETDLLVEGVYQPAETYETEIVQTPDAERELWQPGERLSIELAVDDEPHRVKLVTEHGIAATITDVETEGSE